MSDELTRLETSAQCLISAQEQYDEAAKAHKTAPTGVLESKVLYKQLRAKAMAAHDALWDARQEYEKLSCPKQMVSLIQRLRTAEAELESAKEQGYLRHEQEEKPKHAR